MTDSEFEIEHVNVDAVVSKADAFIRGLQEQVETHKARADATAINAEQTCALIEQKFLTLSGQFSQLENEKEQSFATLERRSTELAQAQGQIHKLEIEAVCLFLPSECLVFVAGTWSCLWDSSLQLSSCPKSVLPSIQLVRFLVRYR